MTKKILTLILILILVLISFLLFLKVNLDYQQINDMKGAAKTEEVRYLENLSELTAGYNELQNKYDTLEVAYKSLGELENTKQTMFEGTFTATAYTSEECGFITKLGIDLRENYSRYFNIAAVDPKVIPLGSILLIEFSDGSIKPYLAADTGSAIKGNRVDIFMRDVEEAKIFGRQTLEVQVIQ